MDGKVLVIDDEIHLRTMMCEWLEEAGYVAYMAPGGEEGLRILSEKRPDVVVSDIWMPGMDGYHFSRLARKNSDVSIILMSGVSSEIEVLKNMDVGADGILIKPFDMDEFLNRVEKILEERSHRTPTKLSTPPPAKAPVDDQGEAYLLEAYRSLSKEDQHLIIDLTERLRGD